MSGEADMSAAFREFLASQGYDEDGMFDVEEMELAFETGMLVRAAAAAQPQPAPELAAAMAETRELRQLVIDMLTAFTATGSGHSARVGQVQIARWRKRAGLEA